MSEIHATDTSAPGGWIDLREPPSTVGVKTAARPKTSRVDPDAAIAFALFLTMLFALQLETAGAALFSLISVGYGGWRLKQLSAVLLPRAFLFAFPILAVLSTLWSEQPLMTFKYSLEFALTVFISLLLSAAPRPKSVIEGIFFAFAVFILVSLELGGSVGMGANGDTAFAGLNDSKNLLADSAASGFLVSLAVFYIGIQDRKFSRCAASVLVAALDIYAILMARSAGAVVGLAIAVAIFLFFLSLHRANFSVRATVLGVVGFFLAFAALAYETLSDIVSDVATRYFDKDTTFTGRTYLWQRAGELINERPLLGRGFHAFWYQGNPDAEGLWRYSGIANEGGFNFHNNFIELLIHFGWLGTVLFALCFIVALALLILRFVRRPNLAVCFWLSAVLYECARMPFETVAPGEFSYSTVLILMGLGCALGGAPARVLSASTRAR